jgi:periplasmic divalent cation tolerance protein
LEDKYIVVLTTVGTKQFAHDLARSLVEARLAACVQIQSVQSVYRWKDKVCSEPEYVLAIKTTAARYAELEQFIRANHSYETPEIVRVEIAGGSREYLGWIGENVERG